MFSFTGSKLGLGPVTVPATLQIINPLQVALAMSDGFAVDVALSVTLTDNRKIGGFESTQVAGYGVFTIHWGMPDDDRTVSFTATFTPYQAPNGCEIFFSGTYVLGQKPVSVLYRSPAPSQLQVHTRSSFLLVPSLS